MKKRMKFLSIAAAFALTATAAFATRDDQETQLTVHETIEVPGATLTPGEYIIELADTTADESVVVFRDANTNQVKSLALTIDAVSDGVPNDSKFVFYETPAGEPPVMRAWFYPGDPRGHQFVYPESRGNEIAADARRHVPTVADSDYQQMNATRESKVGDPLLMKMRDVRFYAMSPEGEQTSLDEGREMNQEADSRLWEPDRYVRGMEVPETRVERQIRKEVVTLPFYSIWDHVEYQVNDGEVTLMGSVYRPSMKKSVERVVNNVEGVRTVDNRIEVQPTSSFDDQIRRATYRAIYGHPSLQNYQLRAVPPIHIIVENGKVTLEGVVQNRMDKNIAGIQANGVSGVFDVENNLRTES